jgi:predicted RNase H-like nuclease (RuvC/YqgF family)
MVHEVDIKRVVRGPADLEERIEQLLKQKELLKFHCKKSGGIIKSLQEEVESLRADLARAKEDHQYDNLVHQKELESLRKNNGPNI